MKCNATQWYFSSWPPGFWHDASFFVTTKSVPLLNYTEEELDLLLSHPIVSVRSYPAVGCDYTSISQHGVLGGVEFTHCTCQAL